MSKFLLLLFWLNVIFSWTKMTDAFHCSFQKVVSEKKSYLYPLASFSLEENDSSELSITVAGEQISWIMFTSLAKYLLLPHNFRWNLWKKTRIPSLAVVCWLRCNRICLKTQVNGDFHLFPQQIFTEDYQVVLCGGQKREEYVASALQNLTQPCLVLLLVMVSDRSSNWWWFWPLLSPAWWAAMTSPVHVLWNIFSCLFHLISKFF